MVTYVGRKNDCVKINGQFVSPVVVENELLKYTGIDDCMVAAVMFEDKLVLAANIVMEAGIPEPGLGSIRNFLRDRLEPHMIPKIIKFTNEIPKTTTTKKIRAKILV
jgi:acyl-coenzyme A synthetase/AMP-(fatty) acid ligase